MLYQNPRFALPLLAFAALAGCASAPPAQTESVVPERHNFKPALSINQLMVSVIDHNAHILWNAGDPKRAPKSDNDWHALEHAAITIAAGGNMILLPGTGPNDAVWVNEKEWQQFTQQQTDAAMVALKSIEAKDLNGMLAAGDELVKACEDCHAKYKTDIPKHVAKPSEQPEHFGEKH